MLNKLIILCMKFGIAATILLYLVNSNRLNLKPVRSIDINVNSTIFFVLGLVSVALGILFLAYRLLILLRFKGFHIRYPYILAITYLGSLASILLPGLIGGDALKAIYICYNVSERRIDAISTIIIDRLLGLYSLLLLGTISIIAAWLIGYLPFRQKILIIPLLLVVAGLLAGVLMATINLSKWKRLKRLYGIVPTKFRMLIRSLVLYIRSPKLIIYVILLSLVNHVLVIFSFAIVGQLLKDNLSIVDHLILDPSAMLMNIVPLTPGGIGIAESAFSYLYELSGSSQGALIGILGRILQYLVFIIGGMGSLLVLDLKIMISSSRK